MAKRIYAHKKTGDIHFGVNAPSAEFAAGTNADVEKALKGLNGRKLWRCTVCNDLHVGIEPPKQCPTCNNVDVYIEVSEKEFRSLLG